MLKTLIKKQMMEVFRGYFYNFKKNKARTRGGIIGMFVLYAFIMFGILGVMFTGLSVNICGPLCTAGMDWLYFVLTSGIAVLLGAFGSVFNTYSSLYLSKDNDLLLSMPIPVKYIIASRLVNVYLLGLLYSGVALLPAVIVFWIFAEFSLRTAAGGLVLLLTVSVIVLVLSCLLGWCVAKISQKLKNKSFVTVLASLAFIVLYYVFYFKAQNIIQDLILNAAVYGEKIKGSAYGLYLFGLTGTGSGASMAIFAALSAVLLAVTWTVLSRTFIGIATSTASAAKTKYRESAAVMRTPFRALLSKEFSKFTSSPNYMLNCGLGILLIPAAGVLMLVKGPALTEIFGEVFAARPGVAWIVITAALCLMTSMNDMSAPSVSLEGKNIWIPQSLPVDSKTVLRAKTVMHLILTCVPMFIAVTCACFLKGNTPAEKIMMFIFPMVFAAFSAVFSSFVGLKMPNLAWTNEIVPIKQSGAVTVALFGGWAVAAVFCGLYFVLGYRLGAAAWLGIWTVVLAAVSLVLWRWIGTKGARIFDEL